MTARFSDLTSEEVAVVNEVIRSALTLTHGASENRRAIMVTHAAAKLVGVTMAAGSYPHRRIDSGWLSDQTESAFDAVKTSAFNHAMAERVCDPDPVDKIFTRWLGESRGAVAHRALMSTP